MNVINHYDMLVEENNDPFHDPEPLQVYMDKWDGKPFLDALKLDKTKDVLEIGVGTGRLVVKTAPLCKSLCGIDLSSKTIDKAKENLSVYDNIQLICADFMSFSFDIRFDVIYSSLTFMHIKEKEKCVNKIYSLLKSGGRFILSIDKNQDSFIDYGTRKIEIYPDNPSDIQAYIKSTGFKLTEIIETEFAYIFVCEN